jgi:hypothetical protein
VPVSVTHGRAAVHLRYSEFIDLHSGAVITILAFF